MRVPTKTLAAALIAAALPLYSGAAAAAPLSQSLALSSGADVGSVEQVQYRRWNRGGWIGPAAAGLAAGAIIGGALAASRYDGGYDAYAAAPDGYYAYGAVPGYSGYYGYRPGYRYSSPTRLSPQWGSCTGDREEDSGFPSWACR
jgi:hypothetical protein